jgi:hypothetical protein
MNKINKTINILDIGHGRGMSRKWAGVARLYTRDFAVPWDPTTRT